MKYRQREVLFREAVIAFFTGGGKEGDQEDKDVPLTEVKDKQAAYCGVCKQTGKRDCATCQPYAHTLGGQKDKEHGR